MGSPFPLLSSGQSLSDQRQGYSPRDFGMVPHTPQIRGHWVNSDQSVPHTPDAAVVPRSGSNVTRMQSYTPCNFIETYHNTVGEQDSPNACHDQQVPATPIGGFPSPPYQNPLPYDTNFTSPLSLPASLEATMPNATLSAIHTPMQSANTARFSSENNRFGSIPENFRRQAHTRQTPSLSSRRRLTLEPYFETTPQCEQDSELFEEISMSSDKTLSPRSNDYTDNDLKHESLNGHMQNKKSSHIPQPGAADFMGIDAEFDDDDYNNMPPCKLSEVNLGPHTTRDTRVVKTKPTQANCVGSKQSKINQQFQLAPSCSHLHPAQYVTKSVEKTLVRSCKTKLRNENNDNRRAEIERRVQNVLNGDSSSDSVASSLTTANTVVELPRDQISVLSLFAGDDVFFG